MRYNNFAKGGNTAYDHDAFLREWMQRFRMLTALTSETNCLVRGFLFT